ncbi:hypothetical protein JCM3774_002416 [Rhodotorula dairenensis]
MQSEAKSRSATALRNMFQKMRRVYLRQQQQQQTTTTPLAMVDDDDDRGGDDAGETERGGETDGGSTGPGPVRLKTELFQHQQQEQGRPLPGTLVVPTSSSSSSLPVTITGPTPRGAALSSASWTAGEDAALLAALITLPTTTISTTTVTPTASDTGAGTSSVRHGERVGGALAPRVEQGEQQQEDEERGGGPSTPLARAAAAAAPVLLLSSRESQTVSSSSSSSSDNEGWDRVHQVAGKVYALMETRGAETGRPARGGGGGGTARFSRKVHELEDRWKTKWRVEGVTKNLAAPELLLLAINQRIESLSQLAVEILDELGSGVEVAATAAAVTGPSEAGRKSRVGTPKPESESESESGSMATTTRQAGAQVLEHEPGAARIGDNSFATARPVPVAVELTRSEEVLTPVGIERDDRQQVDKSKERDDGEDKPHPEAAYPTPLLSSGPTSLARFDRDASEVVAPRFVSDERSSRGGLGQAEEQEEEDPLALPALSTTCTTITMTDNRVVSTSTSPPPGEALSFDTREPTAPTREPAAYGTTHSLLQAGASSLDETIGLGLGLDVGYGFGHLPRQPPGSRSKPIYSADPTGPGEGDDNPGISQLVPLPLRRASSSAAFPSPRKLAPVPAVPLSHSLSANRASTSFSPFTETYTAARSPSSAGMGISCRGPLQHRAPSPPASAPPPARFELFFQPRPQQSLSTLPTILPQQSVPSLQQTAHSLRASMPYQPFPSQVLPTDDARRGDDTSAPAPPTVRQDAPGPVLGRGRSLPGSVQEEPALAVWNRSPRRPILQQRSDQGLLLPQPQPSLISTATRSGTGPREHEMYDPDPNADTADPDRVLKKRRWSEADLYAARPTLYAYESSAASFPPPPQGQGSRERTTRLAAATMMMEEEEVEEIAGQMTATATATAKSNALDWAIAAGRPLADYPPVFVDAATDEEDDGAEERFKRAAGRTEDDPFGGWRGVGGGGAAR